MSGKPSGGKGAWATRPLTIGERALAARVFGDAIRLETVHFLGSPWPFNRAFVAGRWFGREWITWPGDSLCEDYAQEGLKRRATFVHELVHVWQAQQGVNLLFAKLKAGDTPASYAYRVEPTCRWDALNIEQQAMVMEHRFHCRRGRPAPGDKAFYDTICPFKT